MTFIKFARKLFYDTSVQHWKITSYLYEKIFHTGFGDKDLSVNYFGIDLVFPGRDITITPGLVGGFYEKYELSLFQSVCKASKRIIDVGGNIGLYTCIAAKAGCNVDVFEPVEENQKYLIGNVERNNLKDKVTIHADAVGAKKGYAKLYIAAKNIGTHSLSSDAAASTKYNKVNVVTLDSVFAKTKNPIDALKIDVEGYDGYVLDGAAKLIKKHKPILFIELVPSHLKGAQYSPKKFIKQICSTYEIIIAVDEVSSSYRYVTEEVLMSFANAGQRTNLVACMSGQETKLGVNLSTSSV